METANAPSAKAAKIRAGSVAFLRVWWLEIILGAGLLMIFWQAAALRLQLPSTPLMDEDTWGYLKPGFAKLTGGFFQHTFGRNFVYPAFLFAVLCVSGDFEALSAVQHVIGLLTGVALVAAWIMLCELLQTPPRARAAARLFALPLAAIYLLSRAPLQLEHTIRPEAVFPFFLALSLLLNFTALRAWQRTPSSRVTGWCLAANLVISYIGLSLKPSMGFGAAAVNLPLLFWLWRGQETWRRKAAAVGVALAALILGLWLPEKRLAADDAFTSTFLPTMLFTIHAPAIHAQIVDDLQHHAAAPFAEDWLTAFNQGFEHSLAEAYKPENHVWPKLGFNADYLIYRESVFDAFFGRNHEKEEAAFCMHYYWRTWRQRPGEMFAKVSRQLGMAYLDSDHRSLPTWRSLRHRKAVPRRLVGFSYVTAAVCTENPSVSPLLLASRYGTAYVRRVHNLAKRPFQFRESFWVAYAIGVMARLHLSLLIIGAISGVTLLVRTRATHIILAGGVWLCAAANFGLILTVAIAHTLDVSRYVDNLRLPTLLSEFAMLLLLLQLWFSWRKEKEMAPAEASLPQEPTGETPIVGRAPHLS